MFICIPAANRAILAVDNLTGVLNFSCSNNWAIFWPIKHLKEELYFEKFAKKKNVFSLFSCTQMAHLGWPSLNLHNHYCSNCNFLR